MGSAHRRQDLFVYCLEHPICKQSKALKAQDLGRQKRGVIVLHE